MPEYITVTVKAPEGLPPMHATVSVTASTPDEFRAVLAAIPPEGEPRLLTGGDGVWADLGGDSALLLYPPKLDGEVAESPGRRLVRETLEARVAAQAESMGAREQRLSAEADPRGIGDGLGR